MKLLLLLFFIGASHVASAQDWDGLVAGQQPFFTNGDGYVRGIRIDSVTTAGPNRIFHPYRSPRGLWRTTWLDTAGGSWVGKRVVARQNGVWEFDTRFGDTVFVHTQAFVGSSWRFHDDTGNRYCTATVLSQMDVYLFDSLGAVYQRDCFAPVVDGSHYAGLIYARVGSKTFGNPLAMPYVPPANPPAIQRRYTGDGHSIAVSTAGLQPPATVVLLNAAGQKVFYQQLSTPSAEIQINSLSAGIYFLTVATQHTRSSAKISIASR